MTKRKPSLRDGWDSNEIPKVVMKYPNKWLDGPVAKDPIKRTAVSKDKLSRDRKARIADLLWQMEPTLTKEQTVLWTQIMDLVEERFNR